MSYTAEHLRSDGIDMDAIYHRHNGQPKPPPLMGQRTEAAANGARVGITIHTLSDDEQQPADPALELAQQIDTLEICRERFSGRRSTNAQPAAAAPGNDDDDEEAPDDADDAATRAGKAPLRTGLSRAVWMLLFIEGGRWTLDEIREHMPPHINSRNLSKSLYWLTKGGMLIAYGQRKGGRSFAVTPACTVPAGVCMRDLLDGQGAVREVAAA